MEIGNLLFGRTGQDKFTALSAFYSGNLVRWNDIYNGGGDWRYTRKGGLNGGMRKVASLGAAKAVCAELSRLCFSEGTKPVCADKETESFLERTLSENGFYDRFPAFLEKVFALGGGVIKVYLDRGVKLDFITADRFVPTKWDSRGISGGAFASNVTVNGKNYLLAETEELTGEGLITTNKLYRESGGELPLGTAFPKMTERSVIRGLKKPLFVYFGAVTGTLAQCEPLGASVFAGAVDTLKSLDIVFDSLSREFILGKKRIIVPSYAIRGEYGADGEVKRYFDANDEVFEAFSASDGDDLKIIDNTDKLRVSEHTEALDKLLDLLCMQTGLSEGALSFKSGTIKTATEVVSKNSRTYRTAGVYRKMIANRFANVAENICLLGKMAGELSACASCKATLRFADGVCEDENAKTERALKLYSGGLISKTRALSEIYGVSLDEAKAMEKEDFTNGQ